MVISEAHDSRKGISSLNVESSLELTKAVRKDYAERSTIFEPGDRSSKIFFLKSGWALTSKILASGTRIVTDFILSGDMISATAADLAQESIHTLTDVTCYELLDPLSEKSSQASSRISHTFMIEMLKRQARMSERLANIGRRDGIESIGHLLLELAHRSEHRTKTNLDGFACPLRQADIGDAVGLSTVHVNRVLKEMRLNGLLWFRNGIVEFQNRERLKDLTGFDPDYLTFDRRTP